MATHLLPDDVEFVRTTTRFDESSVPSGLLAAHRVAAGTWAVLTVCSGELGFQFDEAPDLRRLRADDSQVIPPTLVHHLVVDQPVSFTISFYRRPDPA